MANKLITVVAGCYGDYPNYSLRCANSVLEYCENRDSFDFFVGCNDCCETTLKGLEYYHSIGQIDNIYVSPENINKNPIMRKLFSEIETEFIIWMDDDSHFTRKGWDIDLVNFLNKNKDLDVAGHIYFYNTSDDYNDFLEARPWYREVKDRSRKVYFATGGMFVARTSFLKNNDWPDKGMVKKHDDILLGDLCKIHDANLINFDREFFSKIKISDGRRRGIGESEYGKN